VVKAWGGVVGSLLLLMNLARLMVLLRIWQSTVTANERVGGGGLVDYAGQRGSIMPRDLRFR